MCVHAEPFAVLVLDKEFNSTKKNTEKEMIRDAHEMAGGSLVGAIKIQKYSEQRTIALNGTSGLL